MAQLTGARRPSGKSRPVGGRGAVGVNIFPALLPFSSQLCLQRKRAASALPVSRWLYDTPWFYIKDEWILKSFVFVCVREFKVLHLEKAIGAGGGIISKYKHSERSTETTGIFHKWREKKISHSHCLTKNYTWVLAFCIKILGEYFISWAASSPIHRSEEGRSVDGMGNRGPCQSRVLSLVTCWPGNGLILNSKEIHIEDLKPLNGNWVIQSRIQVSGNTQMWEAQLWHSQ